MLLVVMLCPAHKIPDRLEIGDINRFGTARQLMAYLGLVPSQHSSGNSIRRGSITKTGNAQPRHRLHPSLA